MFANTLAWKVIRMYGGASCVLCWEIEEIPKAWMWHHRPLSIVRHFCLLHIRTNQTPHFFHFWFNPLPFIRYDTYCFVPSLMAHISDVAPLVPFIVLRTRATHGARTFPGRVLETRDPPNHLEMRTRTTDVPHEATQFPLSVSSIWSMFASEVGHALLFARNISLQ